MLRRIWKETAGMAESIGSLARFQEFVGLRATRPARLMNPAPLAPEAENTLAG